MKNVNFENANLNKVVFDDSTISESNFQKSNLGMSSFKKAVISNSIFYGTDLRQVLANYVNITNCYCESVDLTGGILLERLLVIQILPMLLLISLN